MGLSAAFACVNVISETLGTLPVKLYQETEEGQKRVAKDHRLAEVVSHSPNAEMTGVDFRRVMQSHLSLHNVAYAQIIRNGYGDVTGLYPIHPANITPMRRKDDTRKLYYQLGGELSGELKAEDVFHLKGMTSNGIQAVDPTSALKEVFGLAQALDLDAQRFFGNGCRLGVVLEHPSKLSEQAYERLKRDFEDNHSGGESSYKFKILEEGLKLTASRAINRDSQFDESRARQALEICRIFRVPPHKVQILDNATFSNIEEQQIDWVSDCIMPKAVVWEASLNLLLSPKDRAAGYFFKLDLRALLRGKMAERSEFYAKAINAGWMSRNEARGLEDMNPVEGLDEFLIPLNLVTKSQHEAANKQTNTSE